LQIHDQQDVTTYKLWYKQLRKPQKE
jgi:hypothetical protein